MVHIPRRTARVISGEDTHNAMIDGDFDVVCAVHDEDGRLEPGNRVNIGKDIKEMRLLHIWPNHTQTRREGRVCDGGAHRPHAREVQRGTSAERLAVTAR